MVIDHTFYMNLALQEAWKYQGLTYPNPAVGAVVVGGHGEILSVAAHKKAGFAHAEVEALKDAYFRLTGDAKILDITSSSSIHDYLLSNHNNIFSAVSIYTTLEPCSHVGKTPSCASLLSSLKIKKLFVGSMDNNPLACGGSEIVQNSGISVENGILKKECDELLEPFLAWNRENFVFFKWAQRLNATVDGGVISSQKSRVLVHEMRAACDLLVIGGNTVRIDRPTLDARLVRGKSPDILILSKTEEFDKTIPLFGVKNRKVFISDDFSLIKNYKNIMIEGGLEMFKFSRNVVDCYLCFMAPHFKDGKNFNNLDDEFEILNLQKDEKDIILWMKRSRKNG